MSAARRLGMLLASVVVGSQLGACVLVAPPVEHGSDHCEFEGSTACAACLRESCQTAIDSCCGDPSCAGDDGHSAVLDALDACGTGHATSCAAQVGSGGAASAAGVRACVTGTCRTACLGDAAVKVDWSCDTARTEENACAACIYGKCTEPLDTCCGDASCSRSSSLAADLGACTGGDEPGCTYLVTKSDSGYEGAVRGCIASKCVDACMGSSPYRTHQSCQLYAGGSYCACSNAEASSGPPCTAEAIHGDAATRCALGNGTCMCGNYTCRSSSSTDGCSCDFRGAPGEGGGTSCSAPSTSYQAGSCCVDFTGSGPKCTCDLYSCRDSSGPPSCDLEDFMAYVDARVFVDTCSL